MKLSLTLACAALIATSGCEQLKAPFVRKKPPAQAVPVVPLPHPVITTAAGSATIADVAARALPSVVSIASTRAVRVPESHLPFLDDPFLRRFFEPFGEPGRGQGRVERGLGSGVIVSEDGIVLTNNHVVAQAEEIVVTTPDGTQYDAELAGTDPKSDLAVLRLKGDVDELAPVELGDSSRLRLGDVVLAIGNPFGVGQTVTLGIVSAKGRANLGIVDYEDFIQTDAAINPGNSGGALVDMEGRLVGINTAILSRHGGSLGIGFAIPTNMAKPIMESLLEHGRVSRGFLGVVAQDVDRELATALELPSSDGVIVADVRPDTPAARAGLVRGDVILSVDDKAVDDPARLRNLVAGAGAEGTVKLEILRKGERRTLSVGLAELPGQDPVPRPAIPSAGSQEATLDGLTLEPLTPAARARFRIPDAVSGGVVVTEVEHGGSGARAGLLPGDVVLELDRREVTGVERLRQLWKQASGKTPLLIWRQGRTLFLVIER